MDAPVTAVDEIDAIRALKDIGFGSFAGMVAKVFEHPFDLCKVRLQSQLLDATARFDGPIDCLYKTWKYEGIAGLYRGLPPPIVGAAAENATLFLVYNNLRRLLDASDPVPIKDPTKTPLSRILIAAAGAGAVTSFVLTPIELVKCKMQVQMIAANPFPTPNQPAPPKVSASTLPGPLSIIRSVIHAEGVRGLWLGHTGTLIRETGGGAAWFGAKEAVSRFLLARRATTLHLNGQDAARLTLKPWESALAGACGGVAYVLVLFPADSVKSTIQTEQELRPRLAVVGDALAQPKSTFMGVFRQIYATKGIRGLYAGCGVTVAKSAPSSALIFLIYDALEKRFG